MSSICGVFISHPELKIRREVLDWSVYHAVAAAPHIRLNISVAIDPRLFEIQNLESMGKYFFIIFFHLS